MNEEQSKLAATFHQALQRPPEQRPDFLATACGEDATLLNDVRRLLRAHEEAGGFLDPDKPPSPEVAAELARLRPEQSGERIGRYRLLQEIGEGGFGVVWMAEQEEPVRRRVALKIIKLGMDTKEVVARFEQERQALAMMDHPHIAKVLDAGATATGRPFFVMELVRGTKITDYCDEHQLSPADRLWLCIQVCHAVQHAHQKGIIHRDLKPSNILVTLHDGEPVPKVIDFGVAKATLSQRLTERTFFTQFRQMIGTPSYMSPEQAEMSSGLDIDTRSDIYALGVLLYELLTGRTPFPAEELLSCGLDEMRRVIREEEPRRPSTVLSTMSEEVRTTTAQRRSSQPPQLMRMLRGDLDWIVLKALEKDRDVRYESADALATDLFHFLEDEPVIARPPTLLYRSRKFLRRHRGAVAAGAVLFTVLVLALALVTAAYLRIRTVVEDLNSAYAGRGVAESEQMRIETVAARAEAKQVAMRKQAAVAQRFLHGIVGSAARDPTVAVQLQRAADDALMGLHGELNEQRLGEASLRHAAGMVYWQVGDLEKAEAMFRRAKELRCAYLPGSEPGELPIVARSLYSLAIVRFAQRDHEEARVLLEQALGLADPKFGDRGLSPHDPLPVAILHALALVAAERDAWVEADTRHREALAFARRLEPAGGRLTVEALHHLAELFQRLGQAAAAQPLREEAAAMAQRLPGLSAGEPLPSPNRLRTP